MIVIAFPLYIQYSDIWAKVSYKSSLAGKLSEVNHSVFGLIGIIHYYINE